MKRRADPPYAVRRLLQDLRGEVHSELLFCADNEVRHRRLSRLLTRIDRALATKAKAPKRKISPRGWVDTGDGEDFDGAGY